MRKAAQVSKVKRVLLDLAVKPVLLAKKAVKEMQDIVVALVKMDVMAPMDLQDQKALQDLREKWAYKVTQDLQDPQGVPVKLVQRVAVVLLVAKVKQVQLVLLALKAIMVIREILEIQGAQEPKVTKVM